MPTIETATEVGGNTQTMTIPQHNVKLKRGMRQRHLSMIAIGGSIGTGLFVASGTIINQAGPGGALLAYILIGIMVSFLMQSLGEMATYLPVARSFGGYARRFVSPSLGFAMGWNYWYNWAITVAAELSASALVMKYWLPETLGWIWSGLFSTILSVINALSVRAYGEGEFRFVLIKVITVVIFLVVGITMILGILDGQHASFENWTTGDAPFVSGGMGTLAVFMTAGFSFQGTEMVGVAAGEAENPGHSVPKAINTVFWRILLFHILAIVVIAFLVPYTDSRLLNPGESIASSPFTSVFEKARVLAAASAMNAVILTSVLSTGSSGLYTSIRMLYSLALQHQAPRFSPYTTRRGVPMNTLIATTIIGFFVSLSSLIGSGTAYTWLVNASGLAGFITWVGIAWSHYKFRKAFLAQGHQVEDLPFKASLYPLGSLIALLICVFVIVGQNYEALLGRRDFLSLLSSYLGLPLFLGLWIGHKLVTRARPVTPHEADFTRSTDLQSIVLADSVQDVKALKATRKVSKQADK